MSAQKKRTLDKDLPLEERTRKLAPILDSTNLDLGVSFDAVMKSVLDALPPEEKGKWHFTTDEDNALATKLKLANGYEPVKDKKGKQVEFKGDLFWRIPEELYQARLLHTAYAGNRQAEESLVDEGDTKGEENRNTLN